MLRRACAVLVALLAVIALDACQGATLAESDRLPQWTPTLHPPSAAPPPAAPAPPAFVPPPPLVMPEVPAVPLAPVTVEPATPATGPASAPAAPLAAGESVKVAVLLPLSGQGAALGKALLNAAQLALFDLNDEHLALLPRDTEGTPEGAAQAAREVIDQGARLILGPFFAAEVSAASPIARAAGVNVVAFSTDERVAGQGVFLMGFLPRTQVLRVVSYAHDQGLNRFAAIVPESPYGDAIGAALRDAVAQAGGEVDDIESYDPAAGGAAAVVRQLGHYDSRHAALAAQRKALEKKGDEVSKQALRRLDAQEGTGSLGFDAIMLPEGGERLLALAPLLPYYDIDPARVRLLGTGLWDDARLGKEPSLLGGWYAAPDPGTRADFEERYAKLFAAGNPPRIATLGYDATALAAALERAPSGPDFSATALTNRDGFSGLDGIFRFRADGLNERGLAVLEVQRDAPKVVSPAPTSFVSQ
ncbi:MAG TPA: penicillin-binding protein activator [Alphaproteobacteria bacterium]|nr:penicillin-binding protein activator [Alphaproteobacteria bacterium]